MNGKLSFSWFRQEGGWFPSSIPLWEAAKGGCLDSFLGSCLVGKTTPKVASLASEKKRSIACFWDGVGWNIAFLGNAQDSEVGKF